MTTIQSKSECRSFGGKINIPFTTTTTMNPTIAKIDFDFCPTSFVGPWERGAFAGVVAKQSKETEGEIILTEIHFGDRQPTGKSHRKIAEKKRALRVFTRTYSFPPLISPLLSGSQSMGLSVWRRCWF